MAIDVTCKCGKLISVGDEFEGRRQQCPNCRTWLTLPRRQDPQRETAAASLRLTKVPAGISCVFFGLLLSTIVKLVVYVGMAHDPQTVMMKLFWVLRIPWLLAGFLTGIGCLLCLTAPSRIVGKRYATLAAIFNLMALAWDIMPMALHTVFPTWSLDGFDLITLTGSMWLSQRVQVYVTVFSLPPLLGAICFILFLKHLGRFFGERDVAARAAGLLKFGAWAVVLWFALIGFLWFGGVRVLPNSVWRAAHWLSGYLLLIAGIISIVRYALLLQSCRSALSNR